MKKTYRTPTVTRKVRLCLERDFLGGSIVDQIEVLSAGQEVHDIDAGSSEYEWNENWNWED
ncbi:MAG: hypothetical protein AUK63_2271 [bacterium P3]|nr:MAG: hypothetical protein AUK63_2271 [bacterium P3]KWW32167.1 MAG: hypothetical protein F083_2736 [bacterium F083]